MNTSQIVSALESHVGLEGSPRKLSVAIEHVLVEDFDLPAIQAAERAEQFLERVGAEIASREALTASKGGAPILRVVGSTADIVAGFCCILHDEDGQLAEYRAKRVYVDAIHARIKSLDFNDFEKFGARFLRELGAKIGRVTRQSNDQGIDFFGEFNLGQLHQAPEAFLVLARDVRLLFAGQAKHYPTRSIGPSTVRELVGAISLARTKTHSSDGVDIFGDLPVRPFSPLVALIFTTGEFTAGAIRLAEAAGVVAKTGLQLAVFLADRGVGIAKDGEGHQFDEQKFVDWLNEEE